MDDELPSEIKLSVTFLMMYLFQGFCFFTGKKINFFYLFSLCNAIELQITLLFLKSHLYSSFITYHLNLLNN